MEKPKEISWVNMQDSYREYNGADAEISLTCANFQKLIDEHNNLVANFNKLVEYIAYSKMDSE